MIHTTNSKTIFFMLITLMSINSSMVLGATYFMRADGTAANKTASTSCSDASTAMSVDTHNDESFLPDDVIELCDDGGDYKTSIIAPSSGSDGHSITYRNAPGDKPVLDVSVDVGSTGWAGTGSGIYTKRGYGRLLWEDDVPVSAASSESLSDGNWFFRIGSGVIYYRPSSGAPTNHSIRSLWFERDNTPAGLDLRNKSNITAHGLTFNRSGAGIVHGSRLKGPNEPIIKNLIFHDNTFNKCYYGIWSNLINNTVESDVQIYNNKFDQCNSGISGWANSDYAPGHNQHHKRYKVSGNVMTNHYSLSATKVWSDGLLSAYTYLDHEGISFQNIQDSEITNNTISTSYTKDMTADAFWCRAIYFFLPGTTFATTGNIIAHNHITGHFYPSIYFSSPEGFAGFEDNVIAYNTIHYPLSNSGQISFEVYMKSDNPLSGKNFFLNNTIVNDDNGIGIYFLGKLAGNWVIKNNIIKSPAAVVISSENNVGNLIFEHNMYPGATGGNFSIEGSRTWAQWTGADGYDTVGSSLADPLFISPGKDFRLQSGSPAIDAGQSVGVVKGPNVYPIYGSPDIGAKEFKPISN